MTAAPVRPIVGQAHPWSLTEPTEIALDNGARLWLYDLPGQYVISTQVVLDAPLSCEPAAKEGCATIAVNASDEGTLPHPGTALAEAVEDIGALYSGTARQSSTVCRMEAAATQLGPALRLLAEIITRPAYDTADIERHRALRLAEIEQTLARSSSVAQLGFQDAIFGRGTRVGRPAAGRVASVQAITRDDVAEFHDRWWRPDRATIIIAGELPAGVADLASDAFGGWAATGEKAEHETTGRNPQTPVIWVIDRPDAVQADLRIGSFGPDRRDPTWAALQVGACAIGGSFGSRVNRVLREERGYTYGAYAGFRPLRNAGSFVLQTSCRTEVSAAAARAAVDLLRVADAPFTDAEIVDAKNFLLGIAPLRFQTADAIADEASVLAGTGLAASWFNQQQAEIAAISAEQATSAFAGTVRPDQLSIVVCGDAEQLLDDLDAQGLAAEVVTIEG
ncbi:pitrilysin family protein [Propionimicrobium sp. PCR01-08-3]|uniref:M16 family metallopeptidase n=1 Tax=Propionimicrobium sp. PCR01-08-3 TaxID=3052086 RepID=UPI00255C6F52|nr:pitrilysin family protein [Propionimicrobium sp. PCR01-08-3]WIY83788.1 pitrilysin family protein [Propionimicrobium sp. PCR01-08-3]